MINALIVDDNKIARETLRQLAKKVKDLVVLEECATAMETYNFLLELPVNLIFLDIEMEGMNGLELTKNLGKKKPVIIFISSKREYAVEAFELNVADYIIKPVTLSRFLQAVDRARDLIQGKPNEFELENNEFIFVRDSNIIRRLKLEDILFIEAMGDYVKVYTTEKFIAVHTTLKAVEKRLPASKFIRVHRSYIVAINKIDSLQDGTLILNGKSVPVADPYRAVLNKKLNVL